MAFRTLVPSANRAILVQSSSSLLSRSRCIPLAAVRWNSSVASEWSSRKPNFLLAMSKIRTMLEKSTPVNISYTERLEKLREGFIDNSDLQSTYICLINVPSAVTAERVKEYVSNFGTVVECYPTRASHFRVNFSSHQEAKNAVEAINSATEYPIDVGFEYAIRLPLIADYAPPPLARTPGQPSRTIMVKMYGGEIQAVVATFEKHATVVSSHQSTTGRHGVAAPHLFVAFDSVQDAEKVLSALDGKVTVNDHQYELVYGRERVNPPKPKGRSYGRRNK